MARLVSVYEQRNVAGSSLISVFLLDSRLIIEWLDRPNEKGETHIKGIYFAGIILYIIYIMCVSIVFKKPYFCLSA